ncbi:MAG: Ureidoglycolate lyase [Alphaproteobacteria bacterium MarineAlpha11_Bin1]|nr:MAG: Ureidoglycolate lyase [Alphaproteobacteria bacterium MarineAlpha11_Bin1]|tara:strand:- start:3931 stop:4782 length:852 start_codon:yes stop_codon:yes gene_type:complete
MKITSYSVNGNESYGVITDAGIIDAQPLAGGPKTLRAAIAAGSLNIIAEAVVGKSPDHSLDDIEFLPVIPDPDKIIAVGLNYRSHVLEGGREIPKWPMIFTRFANSQVGHAQAMIKPNVSEMFDFEGEMAVIIGQTCRHVSEADALSVVAGYSCYNDGSIRDYQRHTSQFVPGKGFYKSGAFGPWMVTADEITDPGSLTLMTRLNGEEMQRATTDDLLFNIPQLIHYLTTVTELVPGDVIVSGTTGGVGVYRDPQVFMSEGDTIEVELDKIGVLRNTIINERI